MFTAFPKIHCSEAMGQADAFTSLCMNSELSAIVCVQTVTAVRHKHYLIWTEVCFLWAPKVLRNSLHRSPSGHHLHSTGQLALQKRGNTIKSFLLNEGVNSRVRTRLTEDEERTTPADKCSSKHSGWGLKENREKDTFPIKGKRSSFSAQVPPLCECSGRRSRINVIGCKNQESG